MEAKRAGKSLKKLVSYHGEPYRLAIYGKGSPMRFLSKKEFLNFFR
jgi:hypothetical protein